MLSAELEPMHLDGIKITWLGHATFRIETPRGKIILVDPWIMGNPMCPEKEKEIKKVDVMLCTHGHFDHIGDAVEIAKKHNPMVVGMYELCTWMEKKGAKQISPMIKGGTQTVGDIKVIRELYAPDIAMLPIGDHFTMSPREAAYACKLLKPKTVIPMHFGTFPLLTGRPGDLQKLAPDVEIVELKPGITVS